METIASAKEKLSRKIEDNQRQLVRLIYSFPDSFTEEQLLEDFRKRVPSEDLATDFQRSLRDYLKELTEIGVLRYSRGSYSVR